MTLLLTFEFRFIRRVVNQILPSNGPSHKEPSIHSLSPPRIPRTPGLAAPSLLAPKLPWPFAAQWTIELKAWQSPVQFLCVVGRNI
jgi:hypothetical protein